MKRNRLAVVLLVVAAFFAIVATTAGSNHGNRVDMKDDCNATFNANPPVGPGIGPTTCVKIQGTDFQDFIAQLRANGLVPNASADGWEFDPGDIKIESDETLSTRNQGGEFHTFTEVQNFGGGCNLVLDGILHLTPVPECNALAPDGRPLVFVTTGVPSGGTRTLSGLAPGMHKFECMVHPWMRTTVDVRAANAN